MEHIENMPADLKLAKKNPGWFLNLLCKTGCKFTTVTILHIQEKKHGKNCDYLSWKLAHIYTTRRAPSARFSCVDHLVQKRKKALHAPLTVVQNDQARYRSSFFFIFLEQKLSWTMNDKCYWHQSKMCVKHLDKIAKKENT